MHPKESQKNPGNLWIVAPTAVLQIRHPQLLLLMQDL